MRSASPAFATQLGQSHAISTQVSVFLSGSVLALEMPILSGSIVWDASTPSRRRCTLVVPVKDESGVVWDPGTSLSEPLSAAGQRVQIVSGVTYLDGSVERVLLGQFLITSTATDWMAGTVTVTCSDLWQLFEDCKIISNPWGYFAAPTTLAELADRLTWVGLHNTLMPEDVQILRSAIDTSLSQTEKIGTQIPVAEDSSRTQAIQAVCEQWECTAYVDDSAYLRFAPPVLAPSQTPDVYLTGGTGGTLVQRRRVQARQRVANAVYATGTYTVPGTTGQIVRYGSATIGSGPLDIGGPYGWISRWVDIDLPARGISDPAYMDNYAAAVLRGASRWSITETVECVPDPRIELNDTATIAAIGSQPAFTGLVTAITLPLTSGDGPMTVTVSRGPS